MDETNTSIPTEFERLLRFVRYHQGQFSLGLTRINDPNYRGQIIARLTSELQPHATRLIRLDLSNRHPLNLREALAATSEGRALLRAPRNAALAVTGMEHLIDARSAGITARPPFAAALNAERDLLRQALPVPVIFFLTDLAMDRLDMNAPDFFDWYSAAFEFHAPGISTPRSEASPANAFQPEPLLPATNLPGALEILEERRRALTRGNTTNLPSLAAVLTQIGELYASLPDFSDRQMAVSYFKQAANIHQQMQASIPQAEALTRLGEVHYWVDDYEQASSAYTKAIELFHANKQPEAEAACRKKLGDVNLQLTEINAAEQEYTRALEGYRAKENLAGMATCYRSLEKSPG